MNGLITILTFIIEGASDEVNSRGEGPQLHCATPEGYRWSSVDSSAPQVSVCYKYICKGPPSRSVTNADLKALLAGNVWARVPEKM